MSKFLSVMLVVMFVLSAMVSGCSKAKGQAEEALKAADKAVGDAKTEAANIVPDQVKSLQDALAAANDKFSKGDYKGALADAQAIPAKSQEVITAAKAKKEELSKTWTDMSQSVPKMLEAVKGRLDALSKAKKLPANVTKEKLEEAKTGFEAAQKDWAAAEEASKAGNLADAVAKANSVKEKADQMGQALGMAAPEPAKKS